MLTKKYFLLIPSVLGCQAEEREGDINCNGFHRGSNHFESLKRSHEEPLVTDRPVVYAQFGAKAD